MKPIAFIVWFTTAFICFYAVSPVVDSISDQITLIMGLVAPLLLIYMVYRVLKSGQASGRTFNEGYWYDDRDKMTIDKD